MKLFSGMLWILAKIDGLSTMFALRNCLILKELIHLTSSFSQTPKELKSANKWNLHWTSLRTRCPWVWAMSPTNSAKKTSTILNSGRFSRPKSQNQSNLLVSKRKLRSRQKVQCLESSSLNSFKAWNYLLLERFQTWPRPKTCKQLISYLKRSSQRTKRRSLSSLTTATAIWILSKTKNLSKSIIILRALSKTRSQRSRISWASHTFTSTSMIMMTSWTSASAQCLTPCKWWDTTTKTKTWRSWLRSSESTLKTSLLTRNSWHFC